MNSIMQFFFNGVSPASNFHARFHSIQCWDQDMLRINFKYVGSHMALALILLHLCLNIYIFLLSAQVQDLLRAPCLVALCFHPFPDDSLHIGAHPLTPVFDVHHLFSTGGEWHFSPCILLVSPCNFVASFLCEMGKCYPCILLVGPCNLVAGSSAICGILAECFCRMIPAKSLLLPSVVWSDNPHVCLFPQ
jgi:hypothetical protein